MTREKCEYQNQDSTQTLREGVAEYMAANPNLLDPGEMPEKAGQFFRAHDHLHVVFGLDTSLMNEAMTDAWTLFGAADGLRFSIDYYKDPESRAIINKLVKEEIGILRSVGILFAAIPRLIQVYRRSRTMKQKWPLMDFDEFLDVPLAELRERFNIQIVN